MADRATLRVALLLDALVQPAWIRALIHELVSSPVASVALVVLDETPAPGRPALGQRLSSYAKNLLYESYTRADAWRFRSDGDPFAPVDVTDLLENVPRLGVRPRQTRYSDYFESADVDRIRAHDLDVAIRLGFRILKGDALRIARYGVWSYHHADSTVNRGGPPGFWEVAEGRPVTGAILQILSEELDNGNVIYRSFSATNQYSVAKNLHSFYWKSAAFVPRKLRDLCELGTDALTDPLPSEFRPYYHRLYRQPTNAEMARFLPRMIARYALEKARALGRRDQWFLAYKVRRTPSCPPDVPDQTLYNFSVLAPPIDRFWADPFPIQRGGRYYVFFEEYLYATGKAHISVFEIGSKGVVDAPRIALATDHHLSYPNVFEWQGELYMLPEAANSGRVQLYRCTAFPDAWEPAGIPLEGVAGADPTVVEVGGRWWLFLTLAAPGTTSWDDELHLYWAESPLGPWVPHARNPVKSDVRGARPAGRIFALGDQLYRPSQDCSVRYGYGMTIHRIVRIDEHAYQEEPVSIVRPNWRPGVIATHTLNSAGDLTTIDGQWRRSVWRRQPPFGHELATAVHAPHDRG
jgi:hypothetical protein